jgi:hypothetical protein
VIIAETFSIKAQNIQELAKIPIIYLKFISVCFFIFKMFFCMFARQNLTINCIYEIEKNLHSFNRAIAVANSHSSGNGTAARTAQFLDSNRVEA